MHPDDEEKTAFMTDGPSYYYKVIPFGLKNAWGTQQRLMDKVFAYHIGINMEAYVDDMVAKTSTSRDHCRDLE